jgi:type III restriction enzyme
MVFNDEAHHIHEFKREGEVSEVEWQKSLTAIAEPKAGRFFQVDFSATPYNEVGSGKNARKSYFPRIVVESTGSFGQMAPCTKRKISSR